MTRPYFARVPGALAAAGIAAVTVLALSACGSGAPRPTANATRSVRPTVTSTTTTTAPATTTTVATTSSAAAKPAPAGVGPGASGPQVLDIQQKLIALHYDLPGADGHFGAATSQAVLAFQKTNRLPRTGRVTSDVLAAMTGVAAPAPLVPGGGSTRVEVDVARQVLFFYQGNSLYRIVSVSTGSGSRYCVKGDCATAVTPGGSFRVRGKVGGWQTGVLGRLYKPSYFNGNIAVHGALSVPAYPASHGCVRVPMTSADWLYAAMPVGTPVYVLNGPHVPAPFGDQTPTNLAPDQNQAPGDTSPGSSTTSSTPPTSVPLSTSTTSSVPPATSTTSPTPTTSSTTNTVAPSTTSTGGSGG